MAYPPHRKPPQPALPPIAHRIGSRRKRFPPAPVRPSSPAASAR